MQRTKNITTPLSLLSIALVPALLLTTDNWSVAVIALMVLVSVTYLVKHRKAIRLTRFDALVMACLSTYFLVNIPITVLDGTTLRYFDGGLRLLLCIPIYLMFSRVLKGQDIAPYLSAGLMAGSLGALCLAVYQYFVLGMPRVDGFLYSINFGYLAAALTALAACLLPFTRWKKTLAAAACCATAATLLTFTRGAIFALPLLLFFGILIYWQRTNWKLLVIAALAVVFTSLAAYQLSPSFKERMNFTFVEFTDIATGKVAEATSSGTRLLLWRAATDAFEQSPLIGLPYHDREALNHQLYAEGKVNAYIRDLNRGHAHSQYFEMLASTGSLSFLAILMMLIVPAVIFLRHYRSHRSQWGFTATVFIAGFMIYGLTEALLQANTISAFYGFMLAVFFAQVSIEKYNIDNSIEQPSHTQ